MKLNYQTVLVHNTFVKREHVFPYYKLAEKYDYFVQEIHLLRPLPCGNIHNVPQETVDRMIAKKEWPS